MGYKIEIWQYHNITTTYESDDIEDVLLWYKANWYMAYENGFCAFDIYEYDRLLSFDEEYALGFHD